MSTTVEHDDTSRKNRKRRKGRRSDDTPAGPDLDEAGTEIEAGTGGADPTDGHGDGEGDGGDGGDPTGRSASPRAGAPYRLTGDPAGPVEIRSRRAGEQAGTGADRAGERTGPERVDGGRAERGSVARRRRPNRGKADRIGGVAPWVPPSGRLGRRLRMREWARRGFVPLSPGRQKLRHRILPRTVIGIAFMLMATGIGAAFSGAAFYAYYDDRLAENERTVARFVEGFDQQFTDAAGALDEMRIEAVGTIRDELEPLGDFVDDAGGVVGLPATAGPSVWLLETRDEEGVAVVGSAFAVVGHRGGTALVTSYQTVRAATVEPGPAVELLKGDRRINAEVWSWDRERDLALVVVDEEIPTLSLADAQTQVDAVGRRVFAVSGYGGQGASAVPGVLVDQSALGLQHTAPVGTLYNGGPLLDGEGRVLGMASVGFRPLGVDPGAVAQAPDVAGLCASILRCAEIDTATGTVTPEVAGD